MPFYTVKCENDKCGHEFEYLERDINNPKFPPCEKCEFPETKQIIGQVSVQYKGTGFHSTDYPSEKKKRDKMNYVAGD